MLKREMQFPPPQIWERGSSRLTAAKPAPLNKILCGLLKIKTLRVKKKTKGVHGGIKHGNIFLFFRDFLIDFFFLLSNVLQHLLSHKQKVVFLYEPRGL